MDVESFRIYCLSKPFVTENFPFDQSTLVFKVAGKIFALVDLDDFSFVNLKCDPEKAIELRETYEGITSGWHMNKKHWNSVYIHSDVSQKQLFTLIDHSYELVWSSLTAKVRKSLDDYALG